MDKLIAEFEWILPGLQAVNIVVTTFVAVAVWRLAAEQNKLSRVHAKLAAQDRRLELYDAIKSFLSHIAIYGTTGPNELRQMLRETRHATLIFPRKANIQDLINELYQNGLELEYCEKDIENDRSPSPESVRLERIQMSRRLKEWFQRKAPEIDEQFRPYLEIQED